MALGSPEPLTEMSTTNLPEGKGRPARKADDHTAICELIVYKMWEPRHLTTLWPSRPVTGIALPLLQLHLAVKQDSSDKNPQCITLTSNCLFQEIKESKKKKMS
jgi:hypothetical protein